MIFFILTRILDVITTLLNIQRYGGWEVELNPIVKYIGSNGLFIPYQLVVVVLSIFIIEKMRYKSIIYRVFSFMSLIAIFINLFCLVNY